MNSSHFDTERRQESGSKAVTISRTPAPPTRPSAKVYDFTYAEGDRLGDDLVVTERVSAGPYTEIYRVWSERRLCALACKLLREEIEESNPHARALVTEGSVLRRLAHPNIVRAFACETSVDQSHILMEDLRGGSLLDMLSAAPRRRLKPNVALRIAVGVGSAIAAVHDLGYLYRDLKPANVLMRDETPVLIDLGTVYRWAPGRAARIRIGTDPYMAPEQCMRRALSPRTDVFGLGALTYELLTGEWPFEDQLMNVFDRSKPHTRFPQIAYEPGSIRKRVTGLDPEIESVVRRCLARNPNRRFATVADAVADLNQLLDQSERVFPDSRRTGRAA